MNKRNQRDKGILLWVGWLVIILILCKNRSFLITTLWVFVWAGLVEAAYWFYNLKKNSGEKPDIQPDARFNTPRKALLMLFNYQVSNLLFWLNPLLLTQILLQMAGMISEKVFGRPVLDAERYKQKVNYILPVAGEWRVFNGGITEETSHSWSIPTQRFAYDLVQVGHDGHSFQGDGRRLEDYFCFDKPILAPADGVVVDARDGIRDAPHVGTFWMDWLTRSIVGNSVLIRHAEGEYCLLGHLKRGSVRVKTGQTVKEGQEIGRCGHSGNSSEPHLHFQFQNGKSFYFSSGLPIKFSGFTLKTCEQKEFVEQGFISKNTMVIAGE